MSIFDKLKKNAIGQPNSTTANEALSTAQKETFVFRALPESLAELQALDEAALGSPFGTAALTVCALCAYAADKSIGAEMLNFLKGPKPLSPYDISFLNDRFSDGAHVPFSYFKGAVPENEYTPDEPFTVTVEAGVYSDANAADGYKKLFIRSGGADSPREILLRRRGSDGKWFLWEQYLMLSIKDPKSADPWA